MNRYILLTAILFVTSMFGMFLARQHLIIILMSLEILLLSANINFVVFSQAHDELLGQLFSLPILTVGAAESAIGLSF
jgi:NADH-quinone oxidoreductase subunit K